jgi:hypothetical protein
MSNRVPGADRSRSSSGERKWAASGLQVDAREGVKGVKQEGTAHTLEEPGVGGVC